MMLRYLLKQAHKEWHDAILLFFYMNTWDEWVSVWNEQQKNVFIVLALPCIPHM